jgi:hypothetical protein
MENILKITNRHGIPFNVIIRDEKPCAGCDKAVLIYDDRFHNSPEWKEFGQFVSSYYTKTFLEIQSGLNMQGGVPNWTLDAENVQKVQEFIREQNGNA